MLPAFLALVALSLLVLGIVWAVFGLPLVFLLVIAGAAFVFGWHCGYREGQYSAVRNLRQAHREGKLLIKRPSGPCQCEADAARERTARGDAP